MRGAVAVDAQRELLVEDGERDAEVFGLAGGRTERAAVDIGEGGVGAEVAGFVVGEGEVGAAREDALHKLWGVEDGAPAERFVFGKNGGRGGEDPERIVGIGFAGEGRLAGGTGVAESELVVAPADEADEFVAEQIALPDEGLALGLIRIF